MSGWQQRRLKHLSAAPIANGLGERGDHDEPTWPRYVRTTDIAGPSQLRTDTFKSLPPEVASRAMLMPGDMLMTAAGATIGKSFTFRESYPACYAGYLVRFRPNRAIVDGRFIAYWMQSAHYWAQVDARRVKSTIENFSASKYGDLALQLPSLRTQRGIADYLDTETARIDALLAKKRRMVALLDERRSGIIESTIRDLSAAYGERGLRFVAPEILVGIVVTPAAFYADQGVLALRGMNVKPGWLDLKDTVTLSPEGHALHRKSVLHGGDLVVVRTGQAGAACVVPPDLDGVNCIDVLIVRRSPLLDPWFLEYVLNSDWTGKHIDEHSVGTIQSHFNVGALKQLPIPVPPVDVQRRVARDLATAVEQVAELQRRAQQQVDLLIEHRQALITAAVTGELAVPGVAA